MIFKSFDLCWIPTMITSTEEILQQVFKVKYFLLSIGVLVMFNVSDLACELSI